MGDAHPLRPCEYPRCDTPGIQVYGHVLCWDHSGEACAYVFNVEGDWAGKCTAVGNWLESKRPARKLAAGGR